MVDVNLVAVLVAAVASMIIGMLWYSPLLFGNIWMKLSGMSKSDMAKKKKKGMGGTMAVAFIAQLVTGYVLAIFVAFTGSTTASTGAITGFWLWLGFVGTVTLGSVLWESKPVKLYVLNNAHNLLSLAVMGAIIGAWP